MSFWDIRVKNTDVLTVYLDNKGPKVESSYDSYVAVRYIDRGIGFCKANSPERIRECMKIAKKSQRGSIKWKGYIPFRDEYIITHEVPDIDECMEFVKDVATNFDKKWVKSFKVYISYVYEEMCYENSEGSYLVQGIPRIRLISYLKGKLGSKVQSTYNIQSFIGGYEKLGDPTTFAKETLSILRTKLKAKKAPAGRLPVIVDNELAGVFMHEALGHACEADLIIQDMSVLKGLLGKKIASNISISDNPLVNSFGHYKYDDEGVPAREKFLIESGKLVGFLHSRTTASELDATPNGNGRAMANEYPIPRMSNIVIYPGSWRREELFEEIKLGVYAIASNGGEVDPKTGNFIFNANYGYVIRNGEVKEPIVDFTLSGNILSVLKKVKAANDVLASVRGGMCGKSGQNVPVSEVAPHLYVGEVIVGGTERI